MNSLVALAVNMVPDLVRLIGGDKTDTFQQKITEAIAKITDTSDEVAAKAKVESDPNLKQDLQGHLAVLAVEEAKAQEAGEQARRTVELDVLKEQFAEASRQREDDLARFREEMKSTQSAQAFFSDTLKSGSTIVWINPTLSLIVTGGFMALVFFLWKFPADGTENNQVFNIALGALATAFTTVIGFHFGSSIGSKEKDSVTQAIIKEGIVQRDEARVGAPPANSSRSDTRRESLTGAGAVPATVDPQPTKSADAGIAATPSGTSLFDTKAPVLMTLLMKEVGLTAFQAGGVLGNVGLECNGFRNYQEIGQPPGRGGWGICQWTGPRRRAFEAWANGKNHAFESDDANYGFLLHELATSESAARDALKQTRSLEEATEVFMSRFERPGVKNLSGRMTWARRAMAVFHV